MLHLVICTTVTATFCCYTIRRAHIYMCATEALQHISVCVTDMYIHVCDGSAATHIQMPYGIFLRRAHPSLHVLSFFLHKSQRWYGAFVYLHKIESTVVERHQRFTPCFTIAKRCVNIWLRLWSESFSLQWQIIASPIGLPIGFNWKGHIYYTLGLGLFVAHFVVQATNYLIWVLA